MTSPTLSAQLQSSLRLGIGIAFQLLFLSACGTPLIAVLETDGSESSSETGETGNETSTETSGTESTVFISATPQVAVADSFSCALLRNGTVKCWGLNEANQLGFARSDLYYAPVDVTPLDGEVRRVSTHNATCVLLSNGTVKCFGMVNTVRIETPTLATGLSSVSSISAGGNQAFCALLTAGTVKCWGETDYMGGAGTTGNVNTPTLIPGLSGIQEIKLGQFGACARSTAGQIYCWTTGHAPAQLKENSSTVFTGALSLFAGQSVFCTTRTETVDSSPQKRGYCWSFNFTTGNPTYVQVITDGTSTLNGVEEVVLGVAFKCERMTDGGVYCSGNPEYLGNDTRTTSGTHVLVLSGATQVVAVGENACARLTSGEVKCWGNPAGTSYSHGSGAAPTSRAPVSVVSGPDSTSPLSGVTDIQLLQIESEQGAYLVTLTDGSKKAWGLNTSEGINERPAYIAQPDSAVTGLTEVIQIAVIDTGACALKFDGTVHCWGNGLPLDGDLETPNTTQISGLSGVTQIVGGQYTFCALLGTGSVRCWGAEYLGDGNSSSNTNTPTSVLTSASQELSEVIRLFGGESSTCALQLDGDLYCWGQSGKGTLRTAADGALDDVAVPYATRMDGLNFTSLLDSSRSGAEMATFATTHACNVIDANNDGIGETTCWGQDTSVGTGASSGTIVAPTLVSALTSAGVSIQGLSAYDGSTCAVGSDGQVWCWGEDGCDAGRFGDTSTIKSTPYAVPGLSNVVQLALGVCHACAVTSADRVFCWGSQYMGALGDGTSADTTAISEVLLD